MWISPFSSHTLPLFSLRAHTAPWWLGWAGFPRQLQVASGATKSPPSFSCEVMAGSQWQPPVYWASSSTPSSHFWLEAPSVWDISDCLLSSMGSAPVGSPKRLLFSLHISHMTGEGREWALSASSPWHTKYCLCSLQQLHKWMVFVNFSHLIEGSCIQQATRFKLCVYFSKRPVWYKWHVFYIFNNQICK